MATTINATTGGAGGVVITPDTSGIVQVQSNGVNTNAQAWVNYNGVSQTIRASYNISSVTRTGAGLYTVNFTNAMVDANYCVLLSKQNPAGTNMQDIAVFNSVSGSVTTVAPTTTAYTIMLNNSLTDSAYVMSVVFR